MMQQVALRPSVPMGYRFSPTPEELIRFYLNPWVTTGKPTTELIPGVFCVADIYAMDPDALTSQFHHHDHDGYWYFLCVARWKGGKAGTRMNRSVQGGGTWHGSNRRKPVGRDGHRLGFEYRTVEDAKTVWLMEEFVTNLKEATDGEGVKVICKVYRSKRACSVAAVAPSPTENQYASATWQQPVVMEKGVGVDGGVDTIDDEPEPLAVVQSACTEGLPVPPVAPSPTEYHYAPATWQQPMVMEQGVVDTIDDEPEPLAVVQSVGMEGLPVPPVGPLPTEYYYAPATWHQPMLMEQGMGVDGGVDTIDDEPEPLAVVDSAGMEGLAVPPLDYYSLDLTALSTQPNEEWWRNPDSDFDPRDGAEGGEGPPAAS